MENNTVFAKMPIISAVNEEVIGYEILLRKFNSISLDTFNHSPQLYTEFSFEILCEIFRLDANGLIRKTGQLLFINFTVQQFLSSGTLNFLVQQSDQKSLFNNIVIEITEQDLHHDSAQLVERMLLFTRFNCQFAIDDFGAESSNFKRVFDFKPQYIKLDGKMVKSFTEQSCDITPLSQLVKMCHKLNTKIIAEGVESSEIAIMLKNINVDYLQGYYCGKPQLISLD